ncbi:MAG: hypothetical protein WHS82_05590 [Candidatus Methanosuratincola sp.]
MAHDWRAPRVIRLGFVLKAVQQNLAIYCIVHRPLGDLQPTPYTTCTTTDVLTP